MNNLYLILLNIGLSTHHKNWNWKGISSPFTRIYYVKEGRAKIHLPDCVQELTANHLYMIPPFTLHSYECDDFFSHYYVHIYENSGGRKKILEEFYFPVEIKAEPIDLKLVEKLLVINPKRELKQYDPSLYDNQSTLLRNIAEEMQQPDHVALETTGILSQLVSRFLKNAGKKSFVPDERIQIALNYIRKNIDKSIPIRELSGICSLSDDHFIRLFKKMLNCTPIQYINRKKIEKAQLDLIISDATILEIAMNLSFENVSYFNTLFKKYVRTSPTKYRKMYMDLV
ncbi:MAG: helix-turn-helix domain-containing protein [Paludibacteraceae bacterium]